MIRCFIKNEGNAEKKLNGKTSEKGKIRIQSQSKMATNFKGSKWRSVGCKLANYPVTVLIYSLARGIPFEPRQSY